MDAKLPIIVIALLLFLTVLARPGTWWNDNDGQSGAPDSVSVYLDRDVLDRVLDRDEVEELERLLTIEDERKLADWLDRSKDQHRAFYDEVREVQAAIDRGEPVERIEQSLLGIAQSDEFEKLLRAGRNE